MITIKINEQLQEAIHTRKEHMNNNWLDENYDPCEDLKYVNALIASYISEEFFNLMDKNGEPKPKADVVKIRINKTVNPDPPPIPGGDDPKAA